MKITFVLMGRKKYPVGGYKIIYEYANRLVNNGYTVSIIYDYTGKLKKWPFLYKIKPIRIMALRLLFNNKISSWFNLSNKIAEIDEYAGVKEEDVPDADFIFATAIQTVDTVLSLPLKKGKKCYFIQDYENWDYSDDYVKKTFNAGMINFVISDWLKQLVDQNSSAPSILIKDPIDISKYKIIIPPQKRKKHTVGLLYHIGEYKGLQYSIAALEELKKMYDDLEVFVFGTSKHPKDMPQWFHYTENASQEETIDIYNKSTVFLCGTVEEGYGLTGLESMACGCALISTDYLGVHEYAKNGYNALLSPVKDVDALVENVKRVFEDDILREKLVNNAQHSVKEFSWDKAVSKMLEVLKKEKECAK